MPPVPYLNDTQSAIGRPERHRTGGRVVWPAPDGGRGVAPRSREIPACHQATHTEFRQRRQSGVGPRPTKDTPNPLLEPADGRSHVSGVAELVEPPGCPAGFLNCPNPVTAPESNWMPGPGGALQPAWEQAFVRAAIPGRTVVERRRRAMNRPISVVSVASATTRKVSETTKATASMTRLGAPIRDVRRVARSRRATDRTLGLADDRWRRSSARVLVLLTISSEGVRRGSSRNDGDSAAPA